MSKKTEETIVVIAEVMGATQAELLRSLLESQGIPAVLSGESAALAIGLSSSVMGFVQILVRGEHAADAHEILKAYETGELATIDLENTEELTEE